MGWPTKEVGKNGAADKAGIQAGDIITKFDGLTISDKESLVKNLEYYASGETVEVVLQRAGEGGYKEVTVNVTLDKQVLSSDGQSKNSQENQQSQEDDKERSEQQNDLSDLFRFFR